MSWQHSLHIQTIPEPHSDGWKRDPGHLQESEILMLVTVVTVVYTLIKTNVHLCSAHGHMTAIPGSVYSFYPDIISQAF